MEKSKNYKKINFSSQNVSAEHSFFLHRCKKKQDFFAEIFLHRVEKKLKQPWLFLSLCIIFCIKNVWQHTTNKYA